jgi:DNA-directed RNA polymerase specialized sigma24 family protein
MRDEGGFEDYVDARLSSLHRLAFLLTASDAGAQDLVHVTLGRAYDTWPRIRGTGMPDDHVRGILVTTFVAAGRRAWQGYDVIAADPPDVLVAPPPPPQVLRDRDLLWPMVCTLPQRQRVVLVLQHYEGLSEREVAEVLGCTAGSVTSTADEAMQALRRGVAAIPFAGGVERVGLDPDLDLENALRGAAESHVGVVPDLVGLAADGTRRRGARAVRRRLVGLACAAVVAAVPFAVDPGTARSEEPPVAAPSPAPLRTVEALPLGDPPSIPSCDGANRIVLADGPVAAPCGVMIPRGGSTLHLSRDGVGLLADGRLRPLDRRSSTSWFPSLSHDGRWAAWVVRAPHQPDGAALLVVDLAGGGQVTEVPWHTRDGWVPGIDDLGRVYFVDFGTGEVTAHDLRTRETFRVTQVPPHSRSSVRFVTADGFGTHPWTLRVDSRIGVEGATAVTVGTVTADGRFTQQHAVDRDWTTFSPDRSRAVHETADGFVVSGRGDGEDVRLALPAPGNALWHPVWESDDAVLFQFDPESPAGPVTGSNGLGVPARRTWLLRCDVDDGSCEVALAPGWAAGVAGPVYR